MNPLAKYMVSDLMKIAYNLVVKDEVCFNYMTIRNNLCSNTYYFHIYKRKNNRLFFKFL